MKKIISSLLLVAFCLFCFAPQSVSANSAMNVQKATEIAKSLINIPKDVKNFSSNYSEYNARGAWDLTWETDDGFIYVTVDALSGEIIQYHQYVNNMEPANVFPSINKNEALKIAKEFLAKAVPSRYLSLQIVEDENYEVYGYNNPNITINYQRLVNNIPYAQNGAYITISGVSGQVLSYSINWDYDLDYKASTGIISKEKAADLLKDKAFELMYYKPYDSKDKVLLVYGLKNGNNSYIDAHTGEYTEIFPYYKYMLGGDRGAANLSEAKVELSPVELKEIDAVQGLISKEEAINIVKKYITISDDFKLTHSNLYQEYQNKDLRIWSFDWQSDSGEFSRYISASIDAKTGELLYFYKPIIYTADREKQKANYTYEQAKKIAEDFIAHMQPQKAKQIRINESQQQRLLREIRISDRQNDTKELGFEFIRLVNGIPFYDNKFNLTVDLISGEIIHYNYNWSNYNFPAPNKVISKEEAFNKLTENNSIKLEYLRTSEFYTPEANNKKVGLYYHFSNSEPGLIDAFKGTALKNNGEEFKKKVPPSFTDIKGHPAENDINTLLSLGIITGNENRLFLPNNNITNAEFIKMLVLAIGAYPGEGKKIEALGNEWYSPYYQIAINRKIIDKNNIPAPNEHLTRLNAAYMLMRAMNLGYIADLQGIYKLSAQDANTVKEKDLGYIALSTQLGLLPLKNNQVRINDVIQRGEAATTIVQLIKVYKR